MSIDKLNKNGKVHPKIKYMLILVISLQKALYIYTIIYFFEANVYLQLGRHKVFLQCEQACESLDDLILRKIYRNCHSYK